MIASKIWDSFAGGRYTRGNSLAISSDHSLIAQNIIFGGDRAARKRPGYTFIVTNPFRPSKMFDFRRQSDGKQFDILTGASRMAVMNADGTGYTYLGAVPGPDVYDWQTNVFAAYGSGGDSAFRLIDVGGVLTKYQWGINAPTVAPTISLSSGTLTLTYGRQYCYCYVSKWTDSTGTQRLHIGPPSPLSAQTGPFTSQVVTVGAITPSTDPQVTHVWIFSTNDTPFNTTSAFNFASEIVNGVTSWGDSQLDSALDGTRLAPFDNQPAPPGRINIGFMGCICVAGIKNKPDLVQISGLEETPLGIPQESFPISKFFSVPGGTKALVGGAVFNNSLWLATTDFWFNISGVSSDTFNETDNVFQPGLAGKQLVTVFNGWLLWVGPDRKLWAWNGAGEPIEISWKIARNDTAQSQLLSMESMDMSYLSRAELRIYSFGRYSVIALFVKTAANPDEYFDWVQLWDVTALAGPAGPLGAMTEDGRLVTAAEGDMFPSHSLYATAPVLVGAQPYIYFADMLGNIYRWPDGFQDNGSDYQPILGSHFSDLGAPDILKRMRTLDAKSNRDDAVNTFRVIGAAATDGAYYDAAVVQVPIVPLASGTPDAPDPTVVRASLEQTRGASFGRILRWLISFPLDDQESSILQVVAKFTAVNQR